MGTQLRRATLKPEPRENLSTPQARQKAGNRKPGRPPIHDEAWTKVTVVLFDRQIELLDSIAASIQSESGATISRAQLLRSLVDAVAEAHIDFRAARTEADLKTLLLARLNR